MGKRIIAIDFDGTIDKYTGWQGGPTFNCPIPGVAAALATFRDLGYIIVINSCRADVLGIASYMHTFGLPYDYINWSPRNEELGLSRSKVAADVYIDDKAVRFGGIWSNNFVNGVLDFKEHWRR